MAYSRKKVWNFSKLSEIPGNVNEVGSLFILSVKNVATPDEATKVRYISQRYDDSEKFILVHDLTSLRPTSIRCILSIALINILHLFIHDVSQTYLQSAEQLSRKIYFSPQTGGTNLFRVAENEFL